MGIRHSDSVAFVSDAGPATYSIQVSATMARRGGTPDDCLDQLLSWRDDLGVDHFIFRTFWSGMPVETALKSMDLLSQRERGD
jgi:alkanesulfonate monooxygenase SsuD/methylene tetrahydromethanopterin reductase-like flavin-dependent oxidoreductase (luciferase family)